jgi:hypothetical protein
MLECPETGKYSILYLSEKAKTVYTFTFLLLHLLNLIILLSIRERLDEIGKKIKRETDASSQMGRRHLINGPNSGTLNTLTPCAACKLLRRRCAEECPFSPYFSPHEPQKFAAVHKVFGASNVSKLLMVYIYIYIYTYAAPLIMLICCFSERFFSKYLSIYGLSRRCQRAKELMQQIVWFMKQI